MKEVLNLSEKPKNPEVADSSGRKVKRRNCEGMKAARKTWIEDTEEILVKRKARFWAGRS